jgi:hypothetical protein
MGIVPKIRCKPPKRDYGVWVHWGSVPPPVNLGVVSVWRYGQQGEKKFDTMSLDPMTDVWGLMWFCDNYEWYMREYSKRMTLLQNAHNMQSLGSCNSCRCGRCSGGLFGGLFGCL